MHSITFASDIASKGKHLAEKKQERVPFFCNGWNLIHITKKAEKAVLSNEMKFEHGDFF